MAGILTIKSNGQELPHRVELKIQFMPDAVIMNGTPAVYYELRLTNHSPDSIYVNSLQIWSMTDSSIVFSNNNVELGKRIAGRNAFNEIERNILAPADSMVMYMEFSLRENKPAFQLNHVLQVERLKNNMKSKFTISTLASISNQQQIVLGPPLKSGPWVAVYDPIWERGHRRVMYTVNNIQRIPGRFAIDFINVDTLGNYSVGDSDSIKNWFGYGLDVLAVADGIVRTTRDDFSESLTVSQHPHYTKEQATGNFISIDLGNNNIAFYEHLKPGSIKVKPGQRVKSGDVIASLGFTGQSTGPHLHFHVANSNSPLEAEGIPFVFRNFTLLGSFPTFENFGKVPWMKNSTPMNVTRERPSPKSVINFD